MVFRISLAVLVLLAVGFHPTGASAQGLIWELPKDGTSVLYVAPEGKFVPTDLRPRELPANKGKATSWIRQLEIKSVGSQMAVFKGKNQSCRWIEFKAVTGTSGETGIETGPVGARILTVLVPESAVLGSNVDKRNIPVAFLPVIKGYRKIGDSDPVPIRAKTLQIYPLISLVMHYRTLEADGAEADLDLENQLGVVPATKLKGVRITENRTTRIVSEATLWRSKKIPFGLAKWTVSMTRFAKNSTEKRDVFDKDGSRVSRFTVEMRAVKIGTGAESDILTPEMRTVKTESASESKTPSS